MKPDDPDDAPPPKDLPPGDPPPLDPGPPAYATSPLRLALVAGTWLAAAAWCLAAIDRGLAGGHGVWLDHASREAAVAAFVVLFPLAAALSGEVACGLASRARPDDPSAPAAPWAQAPRRFVLATFILILTSFVLALAAPLLRPFCPAWAAWVALTGTTSLVMMCAAATPLWRVGARGGRAIAALPWALIGWLLVVAWPLGRPLLSRPVVLGLLAWHTLVWLGTTRWRTAPRPAPGWGRRALEALCLASMVALAAGMVVPLAQLGLVSATRVPALLASLQADPRADLHDLLRRAQALTREVPGVPEFHLLASITASGADDLRSLRRHADAALALRRAAWLPGLEAARPIEDRWAQLEAAGVTLRALAEVAPVPGWEPTEPGARVRFRLAAARTLGVLSTFGVAATLARTEATLGQLSLDPAHGAGPVLLWYLLGASTPEEVRAQAPDLRDQPALTRWYARLGAAREWRQEVLRRATPTLLADAWRPLLPVLARALPGRLGADLDQLRRQLRDQGEDETLRVLEQAVQGDWLIPSPRPEVLVSLGAALTAPPRNAAQFLRCWPTLEARASWGDGG